VANYCHGPDADDTNAAIKSADRFRSLKGGFAWNVSPSYDFQKSETVDDPKPSIFAAPDVSEGTLGYQVLHAARQDHPDFKLCIASPESLCGEGTFEIGFACKIIVSLEINCNGFGFVCDVGECGLIGPNFQ
jgi:hypothetical protein